MDPLFLTSTPLCDSNGPLIQQTAQKLTKGCRSKRDKAIRVYHFVRDEIAYLFCPFDHTASDTLRFKVGQCYHKTNLQIALLRALNIPAGFALQNIAPEIMAPLITKKALKSLGNPISHTYAQIYMNTKWISADTTFDKPLLDNALDDVWQMQEDWDGIQNTTLPKKLLLDKPTPPQPFLYTKEDLPGPIPKQRLNMLNEGLLKIRKRI